MQTLEQTALEYGAVERDFQECKRSLAQLEYSMKEILDRNEEPFLIGPWAVAKPEDMLKVWYGTLIVVDGMEYVNTTRGWLEPFGSKLNNTEMFVHIMKYRDSLQTGYVNAQAKEEHK